MWLLRMKHPETPKQERERNQPLTHYSEITESQSLSEVLTSARKKDKLSVK